jgi:ATP synthase
MIQQLQHQ